VLRRLPGKAPKRRHIDIFQRFGNTARQDASAHKMGKLFLREPLCQGETYLLGLVRHSQMVAIV
jgi:hypothetical protein